ncbi:high mobility group protein [Encephalitozoon romaleae SJ-2008]|uniref:High mobility group protein n=1 Tax=Encephalitozoon romaleae (strain SJ-2008) TaxID=1178016 RepID=I6ZU84_ENCRO|nr:high mobility group protein [Encephalitozoon romaleae SJ-2008]AFN83216.1 high mobility group protein [Encephalitozoon romaleae SJ-2008]
MVTEKNKKPRSKAMVKRRKDPNAPKKPMSGYFIFGQEQRKKNEELSKLPVAEQGRSISEMWKKLTDEEREEYNKISNKERELYQAKVEEYKKSAEYHDYLEKVAADEEAAGKKKKGVKKVTGYNEFFKVIRKAVSEENPNFTMMETTSAVAKRWKELSDDEKAVYNKIAEEKNMKAGLVGR